MRLAIVMAAALGLGGCLLELPGPGADGESDGPDLAHIDLEGAPQDEPQEAPPTAPAVESPGEPANVPDQHLEVVVEGAPELSGRFWAWDAVCLAPGGAATVRSLRPGYELALADPGAWTGAGGKAEPAGGDALALKVPQKPGSMYKLEMRGAKRVAFWLCVLTEATATRDRRPGAWRLQIGRETLGTYADPAASTSRLVREHKGLYAPPRHFLRIDGSTERLQLAPHLLAGQMVSFIEVNGRKTGRRHTVWFPPNRPLIEKLERLSRELAAGGVRFKRLTINSGFRAPVYNARIGGSDYSRHMFGDAADVMVDQDGNDRMDDLNRDGVCDHRDALVVAQALRKLELAGSVRPGGIGVYGYDTAESCAAFVHVDARGFVTRWGSDYRRGRSQALDWWPPEEFKEDESD